MGPLSADSQLLLSSADSAWLLTQNSGFAGHDDDGRRNRALSLKPPWFFEQETATELGSRFPFFCGFNKAHASLKVKKVKVNSSRRQESHVQRRRVTGAGAGARGCGPHHPPVSRKSPARDESSFGCVVQTRQFLFVFSLRCVGFSRSSVLKFPFKGSW